MLVGVQFRLILRLANAVGRTPAGSIRLFVLGAAFESRLLISSGFNG